MRLILVGMVLVVTAPEGKVCWGEAKRGQVAQTSFCCAAVSDTQIHVQVQPMPANEFSKEAGGGHLYGNFFSRILRLTTHFWEAIPQILKLLLWVVALVVSELANNPCAFSRASADGVSRTFTFDLWHFPWKNRPSWLPLTWLLEWECLLRGTQNLWR